MFPLELQTIQDTFTLAPNFMTPRIVTGVYNDGLNYDGFSPKPSNLVRQINKRFLLSQFF